jgi:hypothetical protein
MNIYILVKKLTIVTRGNLRQYQDRSAPRHRFLFDKELMKFKYLINLVPNNNHFKIIHTLVDAS